MEFLDWVFIAGYFALLLGLAWWVILKGKDTADDYFLAGRNLGWFVVGASIFASNIGSEHLVGLAGSGCTDGVAMAHYELHAWCLLVLGWVMVPFYARSMVFTMPEFLEKRYNATARWVLSIISLVAYVLTKIAVGIFAGGVVFATLLPDMKLDLGFAVFNSFWIGSVAVVVLTGLYTVLGGMRAVAYTEALQTVILIIGSVLVTIFGLRALGGWDQLRGLRLGDVQSVEAAGAGGHGGDLGAGHGAYADRLVLQRQLSLVGHAVLCADRRLVVLVYGPVHRPAGPGRAQRAGGPPRHHFRRISEVAARLHLHHSRDDLLCPGQDRAGGGIEGPAGRKRQTDRGAMPGSLSVDG